MNEKLEQKPEFGKNILQRDFYFRHGDKLDSGELAPEGFKQGEKIGEAMKTTEKGPKPYRSETKRAGDFAEAIREATKSSKEYGKARTRTELGFSGLSKEFLKEWAKITKENGDIAVLEWYLSFGKKKTG